MKLTEEQETSINVHVLSEYPNESAGVIVDDNYIELKNTSKTPTESFSVDPNEFAKATKGANSICLIHSHPYDMNDDSAQSRYIRQLRIDRRQPSKSDMATAQAMAIPFGIVCTEGETVSPVLFFNGEPVDYCERHFASGAADCWQLVHDYFHVERGVGLPNPPREFNWWYDSPEDNFYSLLDDVDQLVEVDIRDVEDGDILLMSIDVKDGLINHSGVFVNDSEHQATVLHHLFGQLSGYASYYRFQQYVVKVLRYVGDTSE